MTTATPWVPLGRRVAGLGPDTTVRADTQVLAATAGWLREHADAPNTQRAYLRDLAAWIEWCTIAGVDPRAARRPDAAAWIEHLDE
ncbi:hypothetical protein [Plantactinospora sp. B24E8]|uniref:hypothetical protein n=1 Tax=Plantactinospora sp. B24E8 TaxID=3153567 RepID=UPI00325E8A3A